MASDIAMNDKYAKVASNIAMNDVCKLKFLELKKRNYWLVVFKIEGKTQELLWRN